MVTQPKALRFADSQEQHYGRETPIAAELRRLHEVNQELVKALQMALSAHGKVLLTDPPQDPWKTWRVEEVARAAIAKATGGVV